MRIKLISISILSSFYFFSMMPDAYAKLDENALTAKLLEISRQAEQLQREMKELKSELAQLKEEKKQHVQELAAAKASLSSHHSNSKPSKFGTMPQPAGSTTGYSKITQNSTPQTGFPESSSSSQRSLMSIVPTVTTSPYIGLRSAFNASDLLVNVPTMGEDLRLLRERMKVNRQLGYTPYQERAVIVISGKLESLIYSRKPYEGFHESDIDLVNSELDFLVEASPWALGFMSVAYDNSTLDNALTNSPAGRRISNSNIFLKRGFITLGKLDESPFYLSTGQMYVDFGRYGSALVSSPLTQILGQTNERIIQLGYAKEDGFSFSAYTFKGDAFTRNAHIINEGGANIRYMKQYADNRSLSVGAGYISNLADSLGMQVTGLPYPRQGLALLTVTDDEDNGIVSSVNEKLVRRAPALNVHGEFGLGPWTLMTEYVGAVRSFDLENVGYNWRGATPKALHVELNRKFEILGKPANASMTYGRTWEALAIGLPLERYAFVFNVSPFKNTIISFELSRSKNYRWGTSAYIKGAEVPLMADQSPYFSPGGHSNLFLVQLGLYF